MQIMLDIPDELNRRIHDLPAHGPETLGDKILRLLDTGVQTADLEEQGLGLDGVVHDLQIHLKQALAQAERRGHYIEQYRTRIDFLERKVEQLSAEHADR